MNDNNITDTMRYFHPHLTEGKRSSMIARVSSSSYKCVDINIYKEIVDTYYPAICEDNEGYNTADTLESQLLLLLSTQYFALFICQESNIDIFYVIHHHYNNDIKIVINSIDIPNERNVDMVLCYHRGVKVFQYHYISTPSIDYQICQEAKIARNILISQDFDLRDSEFQEIGLLDTEGNMITE